MMALVSIRAFCVYTSAKAKTETDSQWPNSGVKKMRRAVVASCLLIGMLTGVCIESPLAFSQEPPVRAAAPVAVEGVELFEIESKLLTEFWGRPMMIQAGIVLPPGHDAAKQDIPVCYSIHGFGGSHREAWRAGAKLRTSMSDSAYPVMLYVFLNAQFPLGHHEFADSVNNGPWGQALIEEFIPQLEAKYGAAATPNGRYLTGHSSGGWSSLWLQVTYPEFFGGVWSTAPDSVDFRDFTGIDVYAFENAYVDPDGKDIPLVRRNGEWAMMLKEFAQNEYARSDYGGQFASFDAVFSPRADDGRPMKLFDRETGKIDREVAETWRKYDISLILKNNWSQLEPHLTGKLHVYMGTIDTFRLEGALKLMKADLDALQSDAEILLVEGRDHGTLFQPHAELWPEGMLPHIHHAMRARWDLHLAMRSMMRSSSDRSLKQANDDR